MKQMWINKKGEQVHPDMVPHEEKLKTELVMKIVNRAQKGVDILSIFKGKVINEIDAYMEMMRDKYSIDIMKSSSKGNVTLQSYDGCFKIQVAVQTHIDFDEKLTLAKEKLDEYFVEKTQDADPEIKTLITKVFDVNSDGNVNAKQILSLKRYNITHPIWVEAMAIIDDAIEIVGSKSYIRFYKRKSVDVPWENISLDFASL